VTVTRTAELGRLGARTVTVAFLPYALAGVALTVIGPATCPAAGVTISEAGPV
jgi:hypothetical protein